MVTRQDSLNPATNPERVAPMYDTPGRDNDLQNRDSDEIQHRIQRTRGAMDETLDELGERLNPRHLLDDVISIFRSPAARDSAGRAGDAAGDFVHEFGRQVRKNPVATTLVGAGLAWLAFGNRRGSAEHDKAEPLPRRRSLQDDYLVDEYLEDEYDAYYTDDELLIDSATAGHDERAGLYVPPSYSEEGASVSERARRKVSNASQTVGDASESAWESTKQTASSAGHSVSDTASSVAGAIGSAASATGEAISDTASSVVDGVQSAATSVGSTLSSAGSSTKQSARDAYLRSRATGRDAYRGTARLGNRTGRRVTSASHRGGDQLSAAAKYVSEKSATAQEEYPLAVGLGVLALGALAGLAIPRTRREDEWMGEASDELKEEAQQTGVDAYGRAQEAVASTVETAKQSADAHGLTGDSLVDRAARVVEKTAKSVKEAAKEEGLSPTQLKDDAKAVAKETGEQAEAEASDASAKAQEKAEAIDSDAKKAIGS